MDIPRSKQELSRDFQKLLNDARNLVDATRGEVDDGTAKARERLQESLASAEEAYADLEARVRHQAKDTDRLIRDHPYHAMGATFVVGLLLGLLGGRR